MLIIFNLEGGSLQPLDGVGPLGAATTMGLLPSMVPDHEVAGPGKCGHMGGWKNSVFAAGYRNDRK